MASARMPLILSVAGEDRLQLIAMRGDALPVALAKFRSGEEPVQVVDRPVEAAAIETTPGSVLLKAFQILDGIREAPPSPAIPGGSLADLCQVLLNRIDSPLTLLIRIAAAVASAKRIGGSIATILGKDSAAGE